MRNLKILSLLIITTFLFLALFVFPKKISAQGYFTCVWIDKNPQTGEPLSQGACGPIPATFAGSTEFCDSGYNLDYAACYNLAKTEPECNNLAGRHFPCITTTPSPTFTSQPQSSVQCKYDINTDQCFDCDIGGGNCRAASSDCQDYCKQQREAVSNIVTNCLGGEQGLPTAIGCIPISDANSFISFVLKWALGIAGGIAFLLILVAGFQIITSRGDPNRLKAGQELLTSAIAGLILLIFSIFILRIIGVNILQIPGFGAK